jgi:hypothetical protein
MEAERKRREVFVYLVYSRLINKKTRKYWVDPYVSSRLLKGALKSMFIDLRNNEAKFFSYFRMSIKSFDELQVELSDYIRAKDTVMRFAMPPVEMLAVTLRKVLQTCGIFD